MSPFASDSNAPKRRGTGAVEFALVLPLLVTLLFAVVELGYIFYQLSSITNALRVAVRRGAIGVSNTAMENIVTTMSPYRAVTGNSLTITVFPRGDPNPTTNTLRPGQGRIRMQAVYQIQFLTFLQGRLGNSITIRPFSEIAIE